MNREKIHMKSQARALSFYDDVINFIDSSNEERAIKVIKTNIETIKNKDDIALAYLNCAFLNDRLGNHVSAIKDFSKSIYFESELETLYLRSKDVSFCGRSNSRYKSGDYQGAIEDKILAKQIRLLEIDEFNNNKIDYKSILLGTFIKIVLEPKFNTLIKVSRIRNSKYDLIADFKKVISPKRKDEVIKKLEFISASKYKLGDYKGSIKAIRRAERYY